MVRERYPAAKLSSARLDFSMGVGGARRERLAHSNRSGGLRPGNEPQTTHKQFLFHWFAFGPWLARRVVRPASTGRKAARNEINVE